MNKCIFIGRLVNDPEISSYEKNGESQAVAKYRLAINKRNKENGGASSICYRIVNVNASIFYDNLKTFMCIKEKVHFALFGGRKCVLERSLCGA